MNRFYHLASVTIAGCVCFCVAGLFAQQPPDKDKKTPPLPPVNPAVARLADTFTGLDGPAFDLVATDTEDAAIAVGCERGTIHFFHKVAVPDPKPPVEVKDKDAKDKDKGAKDAKDAKDARDAKDKGAKDAKDAKDKGAKDAKDVKDKGAKDAKDPKDVKPAVTYTWAKPEIWKGGHQGPVVALAWNGGPVLASAGADKNIVFWKAPEGKPMQTVPAGTRVRGLAMSKDGKWLAVAGEDGVVQLWDVATTKPGPKLADHKDWVLCVAFSPDSKQLASGAIDGNIRLWDVAAAKKIADLPAKVPPAKGAPPPDPIPVHSLAFAPDGKALLYGAADGPVHFINPADGKTIRTLTGHTGPVTAIRFHPSGNVLATASKDRTVLLWNPAAPAPLKKLEGHTAWIEGLAFINLGQQLASAGADQTVRIWDLTEPKKK